MSLSDTGGLTLVGQERDAHCVVETERSEYIARDCAEKHGFTCRFTNGSVNMFLIPDFSGKYTHFTYRCVA